MHNIRLLSLDNAHVHCLKRYTDPHQDIFTVHAWLCYAARIGIGTVWAWEREMSLGFGFAKNPRLCYSTYLF